MLQQVDKEKYRLQAEESTNPNPPGVGDYIDLALAFAPSPCKGPVAVGCSALRRAGARLAAKAGERAVGAGKSLVERVLRRGGSEGAAHGLIGPVRESSSQIANGHAFRKHVVEGGEFPGISTPDDFARRIESVVSNPTASKGLSRGRTAFYDARSNTVVIRDPRSADAGTALRPRDRQRYYDGLR